MADAKTNNTRRPFQFLQAGVGPQGSADTTWSDLVRSCAEDVLEGEVSAVRLVSIEVWSGKYVDRTRWTFSDGTVQEYGEVGGKCRGAFAIPPGDFLQTVNVRHSNHTDAIQFITARGASSPFWGGPGGRNSMTFTAPADHAIMGLQMECSWCPMVGGILIAPAPQAAAMVSHGMDPSAGRISPPGALQQGESSAVWLVSIDVWANYKHVEHIKMTFSDGSAKDYGGEGVKYRGSFLIPPGDFLQTVHVSTSGFLNTIQFITVKGTTSWCYGGHAGFHSRTFTAPFGHAIMGLKLEGDPSPVVTDVYTAPQGTQSAEEQSHWALHSSGNRRAGDAGQTPAPSG